MKCVTCHLQNNLLFWSHNPLRIAIYWQPGSTIPHRSFIISDKQSIALTPAFIGKYLNQNMAEVMSTTLHSCQYLSIHFLICQLRPRQASNWEYPNPPLSSHFVLASIYLSHPLAMRCILHQTIVWRVPEDKCEWRNEEIGTTNFPTIGQSKIW